MPVFQMIFSFFFCRVTLSHTWYRSGEVVRQSRHYRQNKIKKKRRSGNDTSLFLKIPALLEFPIFFRTTLCLASPPCWLCITMKKKRKKTQNLLKFIIFVIFSLSLSVLFHWPCLLEYHTYHADNNVCVSILLTCQNNKKNNTERQSCPFSILTRTQQHYFLYTHCFSYSVT